MWLYFFILKFLSLWNEKAKKIVQGQRNSLKLLQEAVKEGEKWVWFHAASSGEFEQGKPVIDRLKKEHKEYKILVTFFSSSGYEAKQGSENVDLILYLPFATKRNANKMIESFGGCLQAAVFIKYEYWPAYLRQLKRQNVPTYSIASIFRPYQAFFKPLIGKWYRTLLGCFKKIMVQDEQSRQLLEKYGITNVVVCGDPRFNRVLEVSKQMDEEKYLQKGSRLIVAGSTWPKDEQLIAKYINEHEDTRLLLVPHEIDEQHLRFIFHLFEGRMVRYSELNERNKDSARVIVVDKMGLLSKLYRYGAVAYIGGGFGVGIHNTLEAAAYGKPVVFGPNYKHFREANDLIEQGGGFAIKNYEQLRKVLDEQLEAPQTAGEAALRYVEKEQDAAEKIYKELNL